MSISTLKHGLLYCPHGLPTFGPDCPACVQDQNDRWEADLLAARDPEGDTCRREWDDWYTSRDMVHALHGDEGRRP